MKHSVAPQSRKAISLAFFCAVCSVMGIRIALRFGRNTSLLIARAKANLLRRGKNPDGLQASSARPPLRFYFPASSSSDNGGFHRSSASGIGVVSSLGLRLEGRFARARYARVVQGSFLDNCVGCVRVSCKGDRVLCVFRRLLVSGTGVVPELCIFYRSP